MPGPGGEVADRGTRQPGVRAPVALDAMGGDHAPQAVVAGALLAADAGVEVTLVGVPAAVEAALAAAGRPGALPVVASDEAVAMDEEPAIGLRRRPQASIRVAVEELAAGRAAAVVSAGSTGATVAAALLGLGRIPGVRRPVVAAVVPACLAAPGAGGRPGAGPPARAFVLLDAGGNPDTQADAVAGTARMGLAYAEARGVVAPRLGLLNVGAEPGKGSQLARAAFEALQAVPGFVGNVEPDAVLAGAVDVAVTDGFTGNVFLKTVEALAPVHVGDPDEQAGAALVLGVAGEVLVAHGAAGPHDVATALRTAAAVAAAGLSSEIARLLAPTSAGGGPAGGGPAVGTRDRGAGAGGASPGAGDGGGAAG